MRSWEDDKALCEAATPGPWKNVGPVCRRNIQEHLHLVWQIISCSADEGICIVSVPDEDVTPTIKAACAAKARFLAATREALPYWLGRARELEEALDRILHELGVPQPGYPQPVVNAVEIARAALEGGRQQ